MSEPMLSSDEITLLNVQQLKFAWQQEHEDRLAENAINEALKTELTDVQSSLDTRDIELNIERARVELAVLCASYPGDASALISSIESLLPAGLGDQVSLACCVRIGDSWASIRAHTGSSESNHFSQMNSSSASNGSFGGSPSRFQDSHRGGGGEGATANNNDPSATSFDSHVLECDFLDRVAHQTTVGSATTLAACGISEDVFNDVLGLHQLRPSAAASPAKNAAVGESKDDHYAGARKRGIDFTDCVRHPYGRSSEHDAPVEMDYDRVFESAHVLSVLTRCVWIIYPKHGVEVPSGDEEAEEVIRAEGDASAAACADAVHVLTHQHWFPMLETASQLVMASLVTHRQLERAFIDKCTSDALVALTRNFFGSGMMTLNAVDAQAKWREALRILGKLFPEYETELFVVSSPVGAAEEMTVIDSTGKAFAPVGISMSSNCMVLSSVLAKRAMYSHNMSADGNLPVDLEIDGGGDDSFQSFMSLPLWHWGNAFDASPLNDTFTKNSSMVAGLVLFRSRGEYIKGVHREAMLSVVTAAAALMQSWMASHAPIMLNPMTGASIITALGQAGLDAEEKALRDTGTGPVHRSMPSSPEYASPFSPEQISFNGNSRQGLNRSHLSMSPSPVKSAQSHTPYAHGSPQHAGATLASSRTALQAAAAHASFSASLGSLLEGDKLSRVDLLSQAPQMMYPYLDVDWVLTLCVEKDSSGQQRLSLLNGAGGAHTELDLNMVGGKLRELFDWLLTPPLENLPTESGLSAAHVEPVMADLASSGLATLLTASSYHGHLERGVNDAKSEYSLRALPPQACPTLGARLDYYNTPKGDGTSSTSELVPDVSLLVIAGRFWRALTLDDMLPKLREMGKLFEFAFDLRTTSMSTQAVYERVDHIKDLAFKEQKANAEVDRFYRNLHRLTSIHKDNTSGHHLGFHSELSATISHAAAARKLPRKVVVRHPRMDIQALKEDSYRHCTQLRVNFTAAIRSFVPKMYALVRDGERVIQELPELDESIASDASSDSDNVPPSAQPNYTTPSCQLVLSETVAEEACVRLWLLGVAGDWILIKPSTHISELWDAQGYGTEHNLDEVDQYNISDEAVKHAVIRGLNVSSSEHLVELYKDATIAKGNWGGAESAADANLRSSNPMETKSKAPVEQNKELQLTVWAILGQFGPGRWEKSVLVKEGMGSTVGSTANRGKGKASVNSQSKSKNSKSKRNTRSRASTASVAFEETPTDIPASLVWDYTPNLEKSWIAHTQTFIAQHSRHFVAHEDSMGLLHSIRDSVVTNSIETHALESYKACSFAGHHSSNVQGALDGYLGTKAFLNELRTIAPEFALMPVRINCNSGKHLLYHDSGTVQDLRLLFSEEANDPNETDSFLLPSELSSVVCEATHAMLSKSASIAGQQHQLFHHSFSTVAGGLGEQESSLTLLNEQGDNFETYYLEGHATATAGRREEKIDSPDDRKTGDLSGIEFERAQNVLELNTHSRILLYLSPSNTREIDADGEENQQIRTVGFLVACRTTHLIAPVYFHTLLTLLDSACLPLRTGSAMLPMFNVWLNPEKVLLSGAPQAPFILPRTSSVVNELGVGRDATFDTVIEEKAAAVDGSGVTSVPAFSNGTVANIVNTWFACTQQEIDCVTKRNNRKACILATAFLIQEAAYDRKNPKPDDGRWTLQLINEASNGQRARMKDLHSAEQEQGFAANPLPSLGAEAGGPNFDDSKATVVGVPAGADGVRRAPGTYTTRNIFHNVGYGVSTASEAPSAEIGFEERNVLTSARFYEGADHRQVKDSVRLVRIFVSVPLAWVKRLVLREGETPEHRRGELYGCERVVIASLCYWFESSQPSLPKGVKMALVRSAAHVGCLISSLLLEAVKVLIVQEDLSRRLERACFRAEAQAGALTGIYAATLRGLEVGAQVLRDHARETNVSGGAASIDTFGMLNILNKLRGDLSTDYTSDENENGDDSTDSRVVTKSATLIDMRNSWDAVLGLQETQWIHKTLNAATTVSTVMATAMQQLNDERMRAADMRKEKAALTVKLRAERALLTKFAFDTARLLPGGEVLAARAKEALAIVAGSTSTAMHRREMKAAISFLDEIRAAVDLTSQALSGILERLTPLSLRDEASRVLMKMSSYALFDKLHMRDSLREVADGVDNPIEISEIEQKITSNGLVIWCDCNPAPDAAGAEHDKYVPMKGVIRPDLLMLAWRRGIPSSGTAAASHIHYHTDASLNPGEQYFVEYIPVNLKSFQSKARLFTRQGLAGHEDLTSEFPIAIVQYVTIMEASGDVNVSSSKDKKRGRRLHFSKDATTGESDSDSERVEDEEQERRTTEREEENAMVVQSNKALQRTIRGWLESLLREMVPRTKTGGISHVNVTSTSIVGIAMRSLIHSNKEPLSVVPMSAAYMHHSQKGSKHHNAHAFHSYERESWAGFSLAAGALVAAQLRGNGILFHPHSADDDDTDDLWGVASCWEKDGVVADTGPIAFTADMWKKLKAQHEMHGGKLADSAAETNDLEMIGPLLVKNLFHGDGDKCLIAVSFSVEGYEHANWMVACLTERLLGEEEALMMTSVAEMLQTLAQNRIIRAHNDHHKEHLQLMGGHLTSQTSDALLFRELWSFLDSLYSIPVVHVKDLAHPIKEIRHLVLEELSNLIGAAKAQMVPVRGHEVVEVIAWMHMEANRVTDAASRLTGEENEHTLMRKHGARCIATGSIVRQPDVRARDGTEIFWIPITEINSENEAFSAVHSGAQVAAHDAELSRTLWVVQAWVHPDSHLYMYLRKSGEVAVLGSDPVSDMHDDYNSISDDRGASDDVMQTMKKNIEEDIRRSAKEQAQEEEFDSGDMAHGKSLYEIFTVCIQGVRQHLHLVDLRVSVENANRLSSFEGVVNESCVTIIETLGKIVGDGKVKNYPSLAASIAQLSPEDEGGAASDDVTLLARLHWHDGASWQTVDVSPPEYVEPAQAQRSAQKKAHRAKFADDDDESKSSDSCGETSIKEDDGSSDSEANKSVDGYDIADEEDNKKNAARLMSEALHRVLREEDWNQRSSSISTSLLNKVSNSSSHSEISVATWDDDKNTNKGKRISRSKDQHRVAGKSSVDVCFNVSNNGQKAVLEMSLLVTTQKLAAKEGATDADQKAFHNHMQKVLLKLVGEGSVMLLGKHVTQIVGFIHSLHDHDHTNDSFERTLDLSRENAALLAGCLNELCNEGKASTALDYTLDSNFRDDKLETGERDALLKTSGYIDIMLSRTQREVLKMPGVYGISVSAWDTIDKLQLYKKSMDCHQQQLWLIEASKISGVSARTLSEKISEGALNKNGSGVTSEFTFECGEISGVMALTWLDSYMAVDGSSIINGHSTSVHAISDEKQRRFGAYSVRHREETSQLLAALVKAMARRIFELHRGHHNKKLMIMQQRNLSKVKADLSTRTQLLMEMESKKSVFATQSEEHAKIANALEAELVTTKKALEESKLTHKLVMEKTNNATAGIRGEYVKTIEGLQETLKNREKELQDEIGRREAVIDHMRSERIKELATQEIHAMHDVHTHSMTQRRATSPIQHHAATGSPTALGDNFESLA